MNEHFNNLKQWIEKKAKETNLPIYKLANRANLSRAAMYSWMSDRYRPDSDAILRLCQAIAAETGERSEDVFTEALQQYTPRQEGRPIGSGKALNEIRSR